MAFFKYFQIDGKKLNFKQLKLKASRNDASDEYSKHIKEFINYEPEVWFYNEEPRSFSVKVFCKKKERPVILLKTEDDRYVEALTKMDSYYESISKDKGGNFSGILKRSEYGVQLKLKLLEIDEDKYLLSFEKKKLLDWPEDGIFSRKKLKYLDGLKFVGKICFSINSGYVSKTNDKIGCTGVVQRIVISKIIEEGGLREADSLTLVKRRNEIPFNTKTSNSSNEKKRRSVSKRKDNSDSDSSNSETESISNSESDESETSAPPRKTRRTRKSSVKIR